MQLKMISIPVTRKNKIIGYALVPRIEMDGEDPGYSKAIMALIAPVLYDGWTPPAHILDSEDFSMFDVSDLPAICTMRKI